MKLFNYSLVALSILLSLLIAACASGSHTRISDTEFRRLIEEYNQELAPEDQVQCSKVMPIGSHIPEWVCHGKFVLDAEGVRKDDMLRWLQSRPNTRTGN